MRKTSWPGNWKVACHVCGFWYPSSDIKRRWDGVLTCPKDFETKHPQLTIKLREETAVPAFASKEPDNPQFVGTCTLAGSSCFSGMAKAGCAKTGNQRYSARFLWDLTTNGHTIT